MYPHERLGRTASLLTPIVAVALLTLATGPARVHGGIISLIQNNVLGSAEFHKQQSWPFDPSVAARRTHEFTMLHGDKSERLIERIGLGMDGRQSERREQQSVRDFLYDQREQQLELQQLQLQRQQNAFVRPDYDSGPRLRELRASASGYERR